MKLAYLINQYPKVSHTFIRREIEALERRGVEVERVSVRPPPEALVDEADRVEARRTRVILGVGVLGLLRALCGAALRSPLSYARALRLTLAFGVGSDRGLLRHFAYLAEACVLRSWLLASGSTHVHAHFGTNSTTVALLCHVLGGPAYSFTAHGPEEFDKAFLIGLREKIERARFVVAISSFGRSQLLRYCDHSHWSKVHVVHCGLDAEYLQAAPKPIPTAPRLVSVGRLNEQKGQLLLVEAAAKLVQEGVDFELVLVGDGELRSEMDEQLTRRGLGQRIRITGWASSQRVQEEINAARVFVLPSFAEGLPVVLMEAMALGRPVLTTFVAGIPELVDSSCGFLVPAGSVDALTAAMRAALLTPAETLSRMGEEGRKRALERHDADKESAKLVALLTEYMR